MNDSTLHYDDMSNKNLVIDMKRKEYREPGFIMNEHWHEQIQFLYFTQGNAMVHCNSMKYEVSTNDLVIINSRELHYKENISGNLAFYVIKIDLSFLYSSKADSIQAQFLTPLSQNLILFKNVVKNDETVLWHMNRLIEEYYTKKIGYELAVKAQVYDLMVLLLRGYVRKISSEKELKSRLANFDRMKTVMNYIENNFTERINLHRLSKLAGISEGHFCRLFKQITGISTMDYINNLRINKAVKLIKSSHLNMTEVAMSCGFDDSNYFSRVFKKHKKMSPMQMKKLPSPPLPVKINQS